MSLVVIPDYTGSTNGMTVHGSSGAGWHYRIAS